MEWTTSASLVARVGVGAYGRRHLIQKYFVKALAYVNKGRTQIVVTGMPGAGKSMLVSQMHEHTRDLADLLPESTGVEVKAISLGDWTKLVRVLPGQTGYRVSGELEAYYENDSLEGVVHVVDFGYTSPRDQVVSHELINSDNLDSISKLRERNLLLELDALKNELSNIRKLLSTSRKLKWMVIAVNKVDLFAADSIQALSHYHPSGSSSFAKELKRFLDDIGRDNFKISVVQVCSYESDFVWNGETIATSLPRNGRMAIFKEFLETVSLISGKVDG